MKKNNKKMGVIISIILVMAIIITITYFYVNKNLITTNEVEPYVQGTVLVVSENGTYGNLSIYDIALDNGNTYQMLFGSPNAVVPPTGVTLKFYYHLDNGYFNIYRIKSI